MPFAYPLTDAQRRLADLSDGLAVRLARNLPAHDREGSFAPENLDALHRAGYLRLVLPREFGGEEADVFDMVLAQERLARGDAASALIVGMSLNVLGRLRDEPTMGLSPLYVDRVLELIAAINAEGVTIFMVEQNANLALQIAHVAYVLQTGRIVLHGPADALRRDPRIRDAYLGGAMAA